jgi:predicted permease
MNWFKQAATRGKIYDDLAEEMRLHLEEKIERLMASGKSRKDAESQAKREFGNATLIEERSREVWQWPTLESIWADLKYALRHLLKHPGFAITAIVTLALGIGANVVVFSVLNALVLQPLNVPQPKNLYNISHKRAGWDTQSYPDYQDYSRRNSTFSGIAAYSSIEEAGISKGALVTRAFGAEVSGNYFDLLGVPPARGRFFHAFDEHGPNSAPYIVLSNDFWYSHLNGDPQIIGNTVELNHSPYTVLGIAPRTFHGTETFMWPDFWIPMVNERQLEGYSYLDESERGNHAIWLLGRLKPGVTAQQATDNLNTISAQLTKEHPTSDDGLNARLVQPGLMGDKWGGPVRAFLSGIMLLAFLLLFAACANLGNIFAVRAADRSREMAVRLAIGASRWHILRQLLTESIVISVLGGITGTLFATVLLHALSRWQPFAQFPLRVLATPDLSVYAIALLLAFGSGVLFGLLPARQIWRTDAAQAMKSGASSMSMFRRFTLRDLLLGAQIAICTLLVTSSLVAVRGMERSMHAPLGIQPQGVTLAMADLKMAGYSADQSPPIQKRMLEESASIPGVTAAGTISHAPPNTEGGDSEIYPQGTKDFRFSNAILDAKFYSISPGYLQAAETQLLTGRDFTWNDNAKSLKVTIVNATFARKMFGSTSVIGKSFVTWDNGLYEIVGVVQDGKYSTLTEEPQPVMFFPMIQYTNTNTTLVVRSRLAPAEAAAALHRVLTGIEPNLPFTIEAWPNMLRLVLFPSQAATAALGIMGLLSAMLAVTGIFGMAVYSVSKRKKELGIRVALGAKRVQLMRSALGRPLLLLLTGSLVGLAMGVAGSQFLAQIVYEATPRDPLVLVGVMVTMVLLGLLAIWVPARRALAINPARLLREE